MPPYRTGTREADSARRSRSTRKPDNYYLDPLTGMEMIGYTFAVKTSSSDVRTPYGTLVHVENYHGSRSGVIVCQITGHEGNVAIGRVLGPRDPIRSPFIESLDKSAALSGYSSRSPGRRNENRATRLKSPNYVDGLFQASFKRFGRKGDPIFEAANNIEVIVTNYEGNKSALRGSSAMLEMTQVMDNATFVYAFGRYVSAI